MSCDCDVTYFFIITKKKKKKKFKRSASIVTNMDTWQRNTNQKRRNEKYEHVLNATRRGILPKIAKENR